jgi:hypothetical protein
LGVDFGAVDRDDLGGIASAHVDTGHGSGHRAGHDERARHLYLPLLSVVPHCERYLPIGIGERRVEVALVRDRLAAGGGDDVPAFDARLRYRRSGEGVANGDAGNGRDRADDGAKEQQEGEQRDREVVRDAGSEHPGLAAAIGLFPVLFVGFDERADRDQREKGQSHRVDLDVLDPAKEAVAALVDDQADQEAENDLGGG